MPTFNFKTDIHCAHCVQSITPFLNRNIDIEHWEVDTHTPDKILTVSGEITSETIQNILKEAGFEASVLEEDA